MHIKKLWLGLGSAAALGGVLLAGCMTKLPATDKVTSIRTLNQGWDDQDRAFFYRISQGTFTIPLSWMKALEQPGHGKQSLLMDPEYMSRLGFMSTGGIDHGEAEGLPIGFAVTRDPQTKVAYVGFNCAACHTGQINYVDPKDHELKALRVDGGASLHALDKYREVLLQSLTQTHIDPKRFDRFAARVLGNNPTEEAKNELRKGIKKSVEKGFKIGLTEASKDIYPVKEGFGRLDALQRISNTVMGYDLEDFHNLRKGTGPVSYPHLWDIGRLDWVQWNGSVRQPMARNVGEALGVFAKLDLTHTATLFNSTVPVRNLYAIEETLKKLQPPAWPEDIWPLDKQKVAEGKVLFEKHCTACHGVKTIRGTNEWRTTLVSLDKIGTDPTTARNFMAYTVDASAIGASSQTHQAEGLQFMTQKVMDNRYKVEHVSAAEKPLLDGEGRKNIVRAPCGYKARPLDGIWATAPFLHNGSVPNLYELLSPLNERSEKFDVGSYLFDPVKVGYVTKVHNGSEVDVSTLGNANTGHIFDNMAGAIGPKLSEQERYAIIEFLKSYKLDDIPAKTVDRFDSYPCADTQKTYGM